MEADTIVRLLRPGASAENGRAITGHVEARHVAGMAV